MDIAYDDVAALMTSLQTQLDPRIIDFTQVEAQMENIAMQRDDLLESYLEQGALTPSQIQSAIADRSLFPCYFGSALKADGVEALLDGLDAYTAMKRYPETFGEMCIRDRPNAPNGMANAIAASAPPPATIANGIPMNAA